jgi:hypothetical protein
VSERLFQLDHYLEQNQQLFELGEMRRPTIDIVHLRRIEEQQDEKVTATKKCDQENDDHVFFGLLKQRSRNHGMGCKELPNKEGNNHDEADDERAEIVRASPRILDCISRHCKEERVVAYL